MLSQEDKMTVSTLCKKMHRDCHLPHGLLQPPIDPICMFSSDKNNSDDDHRGIRLLQQLGNHQHYDAREKKTLGNHYRIKIENLHQFGTVGASLKDLFILARRAKMMGVTELDISDNPSLARLYPCSSIHGTEITRCESHQHCGE